MKGTLGFRTVKRLHIKNSKTQVQVFRAVLQTEIIIFATYFDIYRSRNLI